MLNKIYSLLALGFEKKRKMLNFQVLIFAFNESKQNKLICLKVIS